MEVTFAAQEWADLETEVNTVARWDGAITRGYRKVLRIIRDAVDERDIRAMKSLRMEKLKGNRDGQSSVRINDQWRLVFEIKSTLPKNTIHVIGIEDYH